MWALFSAPALARSDHEEAIELERQGEIMPLEDIIKKARKLHQGHLIEVEFKNLPGDVLAYEIEILDDTGVVWEMYYNARTGELLRRSQEDTDHHDEEH